MTEARPRPQLRADAWAAASAVAERGGCTVRELGEPAEHRVVERLLADIWNAGGPFPPMPGDIMRMLSYTGAYVAGAYVGTRLAGAAVGFLTDGLPGSGGAHLHSHIAGVVAADRGRQVGFALKLHQRAWALQRGFERITWTFDPLVRRNAYFNLAKLGARATRYLVDFYGDMSDGVNAEQGSDRLLVDWPLTAPDVIDAAHGRTRPVPRVPDPDDRTVLRCGRGMAPEPVQPSDPTAPLVCEIPHDIVALRRADPDLGRTWRRALRSVLDTAMSGGARIVGFDRELGYLLDPGPGGRP